MMPKFFSLNWCGLSWTDFRPLNLIKKSPKIFNSAGVYRIRAAGEPQLAYIGQTNNLRRRLLHLSGAVYRDEMPYNDPHTAAPHLWILRVEDQMTFECSVAQTPLDAQHRQALEDMLLWRHRCEYGESTLCNHGRFHKKYSRPGSRKSGKHGQKLAPFQENPASGPSTPPLRLQSQPSNRDWMGLSWSKSENLRAISAQSVPKSAGLYKIIHPGTNSLLYIGETGQLYSRLRTHSKKLGPPELMPIVSYCLLPNNLLAYQRREMETDLLGAYYATFGKPPLLQYGRR